MEEFPRRSGFSPAGRRSLRRIAIPTLCLVAAALPAAAAEPIGLTVPEGFEVSLFADDDLAHDIYSLTIDSFGRVVVSGPGYVRILIDANGDGKLSKDEAPERMKENFDRIDSNNDGQLDQEELQRMIRRFRLNQPDEASGRPRNQERNNDN